MKKLSLVLALLLVVSLFSACGTSETPEAAETTGESTTEEQVVRLGISKDILADVDSFIAEMESYGAEVTDLSETGGYLFIFSKSEHGKLLDDKYKETVEKLKEYEKDEDSYVETIEYTEDFRNLKIFVNDEWNEESSSMNDIVIASNALSYQLYLEDGQKSAVEVIQSETEEVLSAFTLPMNLSVE